MLIELTNRPNYIYVFILYICIYTLYLYSNWAPCLEYTYVAPLDLVRVYYFVLKVTKLPYSII